MKRPKAIDDLYRDLRDRKLLPIVALLVVAIIAVPFALSSSYEGPAPSGASAATVVPADAPEAQAAVLAENPGLRNYRKRLDDLSSKNPFEQQFQTSGLEQTTVGSPTEDTGSVSEITSGSSASPTGAPSTSTSTSTGSAPTSTSIPSSDSTDSADADAGETTVETKPQFYSFRLDLSYGVEGDIRRHKDVKQLDILNPVGAFIGVSEQGSRATFMLSSDVTAVSGDGDCAPDPSNCEFLALKAGKSQQLTYQPAEAAEPVVYQLTVDEIRLVKVKKPQIG